MIRTIATLSLAAMAVLALAGCGAPSAPTPNSATGSTSTPTPSMSAATNAQWASLIAARKKKDDALLGKFASDCEFNFDPTLNTIACTITALTVATTADITTTVLGGARKKLGAPPAEIAQLVTDTEKAATALSAAANAASDGCPGARCESRWLAMMQSISTYMGSTDAWQPYL